MEAYKFLWVTCLFVISFTTIHVSAGDGPMNELVDKEIFDKCVKKVGITKEQFEKSIYSTTGDVAAQKDALCSMKCFAEEMGVVGPKGEINLDKLKESIPEKEQSKYDGFMKCVGKIEKISTCEEVVPLLKCGENIK